MIKSIQDHKWKGGQNTTYGLKEDGVGLGKVSPLVPVEDIDETNEIKREIIDGKIKNIPKSLGKS